ncbi:MULTISPECIES: TlpA family protein disulfide reductase [Sphingobacterium]|uniref:TlpA family protein disulfide reductase n=1 Tax=Sphingobacterium TaxID=28453 RepID=UPI0013DC7A0B|nr:MULTISPECIES: TlpA disulfide reductase family protein [unclassified Sphingobacterium]
MKKIILSAALLVGFTATVAQVSEIRGTVKAEHASIKDNISLMKIEDGEPKVIATSNLSKNGFFGFLFIPESEGFYVLGSPDISKGQFPVYLKPADKAELTIDGVHAEFTGENTPENIVLDKWLTFTKKIKRMSVHPMTILSKSDLSSYKDFFPELTAIASQTDEFRKGIRTNNLYFNELMKEVTTYDIDFYALSFLRLPSTPWAPTPKKEDYPAYYGSIVSKNKFPNDKLFSVHYGKSYLKEYVDFASDNNLDMAGKLGLLATDRQKAEYILYTQIPKIKTYDHYTDMMNNYGQYFKTESQKRRAENSGARFYEKKPGGIASDFEYPDVHGKMVSLSGQKGKVVLVDVWATWCGPCKKEIPALKKIEEEMEGKDVVIISISVDELKDKEKWSKMVNDADLGGVQLFAGAKSKISDDYKITSIPRFMVFDKEGKIVSVDAPRPSNPALKQMLEKELAK